jgi:hypothetical protein
VNLTVIASFFSDLWRNLDLETITQVLRSHCEGEHKALIVFRLAWDFFYFSVMGFLFLICLFAPSSNIAVNLRSPFAIICIIVPFCAVLRPIIIAWYIFFFDRRKVAMRPNISVVDGSTTDYMNLAPGPLENPPSESDQIPPLLARCDAILQHQSLILFDPVGIVKDNLWINFLSSPFTGFSRPQMRQLKTFIVPIVVFILLIAVCVMDGSRMHRLETLHAANLTAMENELAAVAAQHQLGFEPIVHPTAARKTTDFIALAVRIFLVVLLFPFTVLSNPATILIPGHFSFLSQTHKSILIAKVIGLVLLGISFLAVLLGVIASATYPWYSVDHLISGTVPLPPVNLSMAECGSWLPVTAEDPHTLCGQSASNWSLLQMAAIGILTEAKTFEGSHPEVLDALACLVDISLMSRDPQVGFESKTVIAFDSIQKKLAVGMLSIPYRNNFGVYCENFLTTYYQTFIDIVIPVFSVAYDSFLSNVLTSIAQSVVSGILGPNRMSAYYLDLAYLTTALELRTSFDILEALSLSSDRPLVVGHGGNGLLAKALTFSEDPWRVSFEAPMLQDSPMAALAVQESADPRRSRILNFFGDGSWYSLYDDSALINNRIPDFGLPKWIPPNPFETFCFAVAACGRDNRFDALCNDVLTEEAFMGIWRDLGRVRNGSLS